MMKMISCKIVKALLLVVLSSLVGCAGINAQRTRTAEDFVQDLLTAKSTGYDEIVGVLTNPPYWEQLLSDAQFPKRLESVAFQTKSFGVKMGLLRVLRWMGTSEAQQSQIRLQREIMKGRQLDPDQGHFLAWAAGTGGLEMADFWREAYTNLFQTNACWMPLYPRVIEQCIQQATVQARCMEMLCSTTNLERDLSRKVQMWRVVRLLASKVPVDYGRATDAEVEVGVLKAGDVLLRVLRYMSEERRSGQLTVEVMKDGTSDESIVGLIYELSPEDLQVLINACGKQQTHDEHIGWSQDTGRGSPPIPSSTNSPPSPPKP